jgi:5-methylcytosine-specific restriction endonuclease McrA
VRDAVCSRCGPHRRGWLKKNGSRQSRGYDEAWQKLRARFINQRRREAIEAGLSLFPICEFCGNPIDRAKDIHVDHVQPFRTLADPARLDPANLRIAHSRCHMSHTARTQRR